MEGGERTSDWQTEKRETHIDIINVYNCNIAIEKYFPSAVSHEKPKDQ